MMKILLLLPFLFLLVTNASVSVTINISGEGSLIVYDGRQQMIINKTTTIFVQEGTRLIFASNTPFRVNNSIAPMLIYNMTANANTTIYISFVEVKQESKLHYAIVATFSIIAIIGLIYLARRGRGGK